MPDNPNPPNIFEKIRGKRYGDINLPSEGSVDKNLPPSTGDQLAKAAKNFKKIQNAAALDGLYDAAGLKR